jgi:hypothetical protein
VDIPALRLVAGFDDPSASTRFVLTSADTRDKVQGGELLRAAKLATEITRAALNAPPEVVANWRHDRR